MKLFPLLVPLLVSALGQCRAQTGQEALLQNDLLAAMSWALFDIDPYSFLTQDNCTQRVQLENNQIDPIDSTRLLPSPLVGDSSPPITLPEAPKEAAPAPSVDGSAVQPFRRMRRQLVNFQGLRPRLRVEIRMLKLKLVELYDKTFIIMFLGTGANGFLDDIFRINGRSREDSFLYALEDLVSLMGVDGSACVHRLLCELGSAPVFQENGLFGELVDLTVRHILMSEYGDVSSNVNDGSATNSDRQAKDDHSFSSRSAQHHNGSSSNSNSTSSYPENDAQDPSSPISYLDAVAAGRHGANCAHTFDMCPISLLSMLKYINDENE